MVLLFTIVAVLGAAMVVVFVSQKFKLPTIVGLLLTGIVIGPEGLRLVHDIHSIEILAEIGVVLLLFTIGMELSISKLIAQRKMVLGGGAMQLFGTAVLVMGVMLLFDMPINKAFILGCCIGLSSTALVLKILQSKGMLSTPPGGTALNILIFQDVAAVPVMLMVPLLAGHTSLNMQSLQAGAIGVLMIVVVLVVANFLMPRVLHAIAATRDRELFLLSILVICFSVAWLSYQIGLSLALGAFIAGLIVSESEYSHQALMDLLPFKEVFTSFFFISIGMLMNLQIIIDHPLLIIGSVIGVIVCKVLVVAAMGVSFGMPLATAMTAGLFLGQVGEFSFVVGKVALQHGLFDTFTFQCFLVIAVISMMVAPFALNSAPHFGRFFTKEWVPFRLRKGLYNPVEISSDEHGFSGMKDHLVIIGFGISGRSLARAAKTHSIPYCVIELNPETVRKEREKGEPILYGDASHEGILDLAGARTAKIMVVAASDPISTRHIVHTCRDMNPSIHIIARTRFYSEYQELHDLGANDVITEEYETAIEIFARVLERCLVPREKIEENIQGLRADGYHLCRNQAVSFQFFGDLRLPNTDSRRIVVEKGAPAAGNTLGAIEVRKEYKVTVLAVDQGDKIVTDPGAETMLHAGDAVLVVGRTENVTKSLELFTAAS